MVASLQKYQKQYFFVFTFCHYLLLVGRCLVVAKTKKYLKNVDMRIFWAKGKSTGHKSTDISKTKFFAVTLFTVTFSSEIISI